MPPHKTGPPDARLVDHQHHQERPRPRLYARRGHEVIEVLQQCPTYRTHRFRSSLSFALLRPVLTSLAGVDFGPRRAFASAQIGNRLPLSIFKFGTSFG